MENSERIRSRTAVNVDDDIISEDPYDNELTLTGDELFRAVQKVTSANEEVDYAEEFKKFSKKNPEKPQNPKGPLPRPTWSNVKEGFLRSLNKYIMRKATWPMAKRVIKAAVAYWLAYVI